MNVYIYGTGLGAYRTGSVLKSLIDTNKFGVSFVHHFSKGSFFSKAICKLFNTIETIINIAFSDIVYFGIMEHGTKYLKFAVLLRKKIITEFYLSLYDTNVLDRKTVAVGSKKAEELKKKDIYALKYSTKVILLTKADVKYYSKLLNVDFSRVNYEIIPVVSNNKEEAKLNYFKDKKNYMQICWTGTYIPLHGLEKIIEAMKLVKENSDISIRLLLWGANEKSSEPYKNMIQSLKLEDCIEVHNEWGNLKVWENYIEENCDLFLGVFGDSSKAKYIMPNKVIDGMSFKIPVLTAHSTGTEEFCDGENDIFIVNNTPEDIAKKIIEIANMSLEIIQKRVDNAYLIYKKNFSSGNFDEKFVGLINSFGRREDVHK